MDNFFKSNSCERCGSEGAFTMSRFNTERICMSCSAKEKKHPRYQEAVDAEMEAIRCGNYNFQGIGRPADL